MTCNRHCLVHDGGDRILLARKPEWVAATAFSPALPSRGETLKECCWQESLEEAGMQTADFVSSTREANPRRFRIG